MRRPFGPEDVDPYDSERRPVRFDTESRVQLLGPESAPSDINNDPLCASPNLASVGVPVRRHRDVVMCADLCDAGAGMTSAERLMDCRR